uniref:Uncharacterized protein n=1 Tax=Aegilops tauschii subsp. strangulata TaxID=200361 RepID=A0A453H4H5_AEGTS
MVLHIPCKWLLHGRELSVARRLHENDDEPLLITMASTWIS